MKQGPWILGGGVLLGVAIGTLSVTILFPSVIFIGVGICLVLLRAFRVLPKHFLLLGFILFLVTFWYGQHTLKSFDTLESKQVEKVGYRVISVPEEKSFYQAIYLRPQSSPFLKRQPDKVLWQAPLSLTVTPGQPIVLSCDLTIPENFTPDFNYRLYLAKEGVGYICEEAHFFETVPSDRFSQVYTFFYLPRQVLEKAISKSVPDPEAGLAKGLLLGGSNHLSENIQEQFTKLGLTHIVAVSGYNIVLIVNGLLLLGLGFHLWRKQATLLAFLGTAGFIFMIGAPASAVRAGVMALAAFGAFLIGRINYSLVAVILAAALMVLWNPLYLWYDAGFQLSFLATIAVILAMRAVETKLSSQNIIRALQEIVWLSVWVYLFLLPILLFQFQIFTVLSIPANILFLPVVPLAMLGSFVAALATIIFPPASVFMGWIAYLPLTYILRGTYVLSQIPEITVPAHISLPMVIAWYIILFFVIVHMEERRTQKQYEKNFRCPHTH